MICCHFCEHCYMIPPAEKINGQDPVEALFALSLTSRKLLDAAQPVLCHMASRTARSPVYQHLLYQTLRDRPDLRPYVKHFTLNVSFNCTKYDEPYNIKSFEPKATLLRTVARQAMSLPDRDDDMLSDSDLTEDQRQNRWQALPSGDYHIDPHLPADVEGDSENVNLSVEGQDSDIAFARHFAKSILQWATLYMSMFPQLEVLVFLPIDYWNPPVYNLSRQLEALCSTVGFKSAKRVIIGTDTYFGQMVGYDAISTMLTNATQASYLRIRGGPTLNLYTIMNLPQTPCLPNVTTLILDRWALDGLQTEQGQRQSPEELDEARNLTRLLRCCPNLENFKIDMCPDNSIYEDSIDVLRYLAPYESTLQELSLTLHDPPRNGPYALVELGQHLSTLGALRRLTLDIIYRDGVSEGVPDLEPIMRQLPDRMLHVSLTLDVNEEPLWWTEAMDVTKQICRGMPGSVKRFTLKMAAGGRFRLFGPRHSHIEGWILMSQERKMEDPIAFDVKYLLIYGRRE